MMFRRFSLGFTLIELIVVIVVLGIISVYATISASPPELTIPSQAQRLASDIHYLQNLAIANGRRMELIVIPGANGTYTGSCVTTTPACPETFMRTVEYRVELGSSLDPVALQFDTLGVPSAAASYTLSHSGNTSTITVAAVTGRVTVSP